jgi:microcystin-dependent protein
VVDPFVGEIRIMGFNFPPTGWATCDGQLLPLSQNTALFSLLGTMYGGDGRSNFALPDLEGRAAMMWGAGPGLTDRRQGEPGGTPTVTLTEAEMPPHDHTLHASSMTGSSGHPAGNVPATVSGGTPYAQGQPDGQFAPEALMPAAGGNPHSNMQPSIAMNFCIALQGVFPPRN